MWVRPCVSGDKGACVCVWVRVSVCGCPRVCVGVCN